MTLIGGCLEKICALLSVLSLLLQVHLNSCSCLLWASYVRSPVKLLPPQLSYLQNPVPSFPAFLYFSPLAVTIVSVEYIPPGSEAFSQSTSSSSAMWRLLPLCYDSQMVVLSRVPPSAPLSSQSRCFYHFNYNRKMWR